MPNTSDFGPQIVRTTNTSTTLDYFYTPPTVSSNKTIITTKAALSAYLGTDSAFSFVPGGTRYNIYGSDSTKDLVIDLSGESGDYLNYPFHIRNWRNVYLIGIPWTVIPPASGAIGLLPSSDAGGTNIHPRLNNGGIVVQVDVVGHFWAEGLFIDCSNQSSGVNDGIGIECDYFVHRGTAAGGSTPISPNTATNDWTYQNILVKGNEGGSGSQATHSDIFQNQGSGDPRPSPRSLRLDGVIHRNGQEGIVCHSWQGHYIDVVTRRFRSIVTQENENPLQSGARGVHVAGIFKDHPTIVNSYYSRDDDSNSSYATYRIKADFDAGISDQYYRYCAANAPSTAGLTIHPELTYLYNDPASPTFGITEATMGYNYTSPHGVYY